jgi:hypothetical protein
VVFLKVSQEVYIVGEIDKIAKFTKR